MTYGSEAVARSWRRMCWLALWWLVCPWAVAAPGPAAVSLLDTVQRADLWPAVTLRADPERRLTVQDVLERRDGFTLPPKASGTLGMRREPVWLRIPVEVATTGDAPWVLEIDHHDLNRIEVYVTTGGAIVQQDVLGNLQPQAERALKTRAHTLVLDLKTGHSYELLLRVESKGAMILPIRLHRFASLLDRAEDEQVLQGLLLGFVVCLILYSLLQWPAHREPLFLYYALMNTGSLLFILHFHGIGSQYLWLDQYWFELHVGGMAAQIATTGAFLFVGQVLWTYFRNDRFLRLMRGGALLCVVIAVAHALDAFDNKTIAGIVALMGWMPMVMGMPGAIRLMRRREPVGATLLLAWTVIVLFTATVIGVIHGSVAMNFWTLHAFEFGVIIDMVLFMHILGLRAKALQKEALMATRERDVLNSLAHTDSLTGLLNRRGLNVAMAAALPACGVDKLLAVYVMDLDGFKPVNDQHGHDVGDKLLQAVAKRLQGHVRQSDVVARLGGDEFVVVAGNLGSAREAEELGGKLLKAFAAPFRLGSIQTQVGLTLGYALAPLDGQDADGLLKLADAAMYQGKQDGKATARRGQMLVLAEAGQG